MYWSFFFQKSSTVQPSIFDMPLLDSISSLKSMTHMRGSSTIRLRGGGGGGGGGGGRTESDRKRLCQLFGPQTYLQWVQRPYTTLTNFSTKYLMMCKVYTDVGGIK